MEYYEVTTPALDLPLSREEVKAWCDIEEDDDNQIVDALLSAVVLQGEKYTNRNFVNTTFTGHFSVMERTRLEIYPFITLQRAPLVSVTSVKFMINSVLTDADSSTYQIKTKNTFSRILFESVPSADDVPYPLQVEFIAGYGTSGEVPGDIKTAIKTHVLFMYENRGDVVAVENMSMPLEAKAIYSKYRILETYG